MTQCENCKVCYPDELVNSFSTEEDVKLLCGICALEESNRITGLNRTKFNGVLAEKSRLAAIEFRRKQTL